MTIEAIVPTASFTISGIGPYAVHWPYEVGDLRARVFEDGAWISLAAEFSATPALDGSFEIFLTAPAALAWDGLPLVIDRETPQVQIWAGRQSAREIAIEAQLDRIVRALQDSDAKARGSLRAAGADLPPADLIDGRSIIWQGGRFIAGPSVGDVGGAAEAAAIAVAAAAEVEGIRALLDAVVMATPFAGETVAGVSDYDLPFDPMDARYLDVFVGGARQWPNRGDFSVIAKIDSPSGWAIRLIDQSTGEAWPGGLPIDGYFQRPKDGVPYDTPEPSHYSTDFTTGLNAGIAALSAQGGGTIRVRAGDYVLTASVIMRSNVTVQCDAGAYIDANGFSEDVIVFAGTVSAEYPIAADATRDDTQIECAQVFAAGDLLHLVSVRNALSRTDAGGWWCGDGTGTAQYAYFAEFVEVAEVVSAGVYRISKPLIFPNYLVTDAGETETERTTSTVKRVTPVVNAHWIGGTINRTTAGSDCLDSAWSDGCAIRDTVFYRGSRAGGSVRWGASRNCQAINVRTINDPTLLWDYGTHHGTMNRYKVVGSQDCGFVACKDSYGAQSVDFTYGNVSGAVANYVNVRPFCRDGEFMACFEGLTSHPGCYQEQWLDNRILGCQSDGIVIRGLEPEVRGNLITGAYTPGTDDPDFSRVGVLFQYGGTRRLIASDNAIRGFHSAFGLIDSTTLEWQFGNIDGTISDNEVSGCYTGLYTDLDAWAGLRNLVYADNDHSGMGRYIALLGTYSAGMAILNNTLLSDFVYTGAGAFVTLVRANVNNPALRIEGNRWLRNKGGNAGKTKYITNISGVTDTTTYPSADYAGKTVIENNDANYPTELTADAVSLTGYSQRQWGIASQTGANIASGVATYVPQKAGRGVVQVDTESAAASDDLDTLVPATGAAPVVGDIIILRTTVSARDVVIRDVATSAASAYGFQLPGGTSITLSDSSDTAMVMFGGTHWHWIAGGDN